MYTAQFYIKNSIPQMIQNRLDIVIFFDNKSNKIHRFLIIDIYQVSLISQTPINYFPFIYMSYASSTLCAKERIQMYVVD